MNATLQNTTELIHESTNDPTLPTTASRELAAILEQLATAGLAAEAVFDGDAEWCPHCVSQVLSEAA